MSMEEEKDKISSSSSSYNDMFMKKNKRRPSELINEIESNKKQKNSLSSSPNTIEGDKITSSPYSQTIILVDNEQDNDRERRKTLTKENTNRVHKHLQSIPKHIFVNNIVSICQLGSYLYLDATTVIQCCYYWLGEYSNKKIPSHLKFNDIIDGILDNMIIIEVSGQYGLKYTRDNMASNSLLFRFIGSPLHRIPHVHFTFRDGFSNPDRENPPILKGFAYILNPINKCFLTAFAPGLHSEFFANNFIYNTILEEFFEPSFIIITCYYLALKNRDNLFIYDIFEGSKPVSKATVNHTRLEINQLIIHLIKTMLIPLDTFINEFEYPFMNRNKDTMSQTEYNNTVQQKWLQSKYKCIDPYDNNLVPKLTRLYRDILELIIILRENIQNFDVLQKKLEEKWLEKSNYCAKEMAIRTTNILRKL